VYVFHVSAVVVTVVVTVCAFVLLLCILLDICAVFFSVEHEWVFL